MGIAAQLSLTNARELARAEIVEGAGDQFLARAGFAIDEDGGIGGSDRLHFAQDAAQGFALADDLFEIQFAADFVLEIQLFARQLIFEVGDLAEGQRIFDGNRDLAGDLSQERKIGWSEDVLAEAAQGQDANGLAAPGERDVDERLDPDFGGNGQAKAAPRAT